MNLISRGVSVRNPCIHHRCSPPREPSDPDRAVRPTANNLAGVAPRDCGNAAAKRKARKQGTGPRCPDRNAPVVPAGQQRPPPKCRGAKGDRARDGPVRGERVQRGAVPQVPDAHWVMGGLVVSAGGVCGNGD
jgi:hypothetical protein